MDATQMFAPLDRPICRLVMGSLLRGEMWEHPEQAVKLFDAYVRLGGNCFDSALVYSKSEEAIGDWMISRGNRQNIIIHAKIAHHETIRPPDSRFAFHRSRVTPADIHHDVRETLRRFKTDYLDICTLHRDDPDRPVEPIVDCLAEEQASGRIRAFGASNWSIHRIEQANAYAQAHGFPGFTVSSPNLALAFPSEPHWPNCVTACDPISRQWYGKNNLPLFAWSSLALGFFGNANRPLHELSAADLQTMMSDWQTRDMVRVYYSDRNFQRLARAKELAKERGVSATLIALAWVLHQPMSTFALVGPRTEKELEELFQVFSITLTPRETAWLNLEVDSL